MIEYKLFKNLSSKNYEHPADKAALSYLRKLKGFDLLLRKVLGFVHEKPLRLLFLGNAVKLGPNQRPDVYQALLRACEILDWPDIPELYVIQDPRVNAMAIGLDHPFIVMNSALLDRLSIDELRVVLGHEIGHIMSGHVLFKTLHWILTVAAYRILPKYLLLPTLPVFLALREWDRKSELSSDRAGLLVSQNIKLSLAVIFKLSGCDNHEAYNLSEFEKQAHEYEESGNITDSFFKFLNMVWATHPFPVMRVVELKRWSDTEEYKQILNGQYVKRSEEVSESMREEVVDGLKDYRERFQASKDPLVSFMRDLIDTGEGIFKEFSQKVQKEAKDVRDRASKKE